ncbi:MAG: hypothetical protein ACP59X_12200 [Solidesulfovibrio sp. DCME]|uniref:hypothetical protein n=1 Tax=Solidesulfovibrio sp. DCME TaxID=3447380 RepID=UPI003D112675
MLTPKITYGRARTGLTDPLAVLRLKGARVSLVEGEIRLLFENHVRREIRKRCYEYAAHFDALLRLQLEVPPGENPRTIQQLVGVGRVLWRDGRFVIPSRRPRGLALPTDWSMLPREQRLRLWLRSEGLTLTRLAERMGVHKSAPGKWLVSGREPLPANRRMELVAMGMPKECLP